MNIDLVQKVIADTEYHVENSADPDLHRSAEHVEKVLRPHLLRIQTLLCSEYQPRLETAIVELAEKNPLAAGSLQMIIDIMRAKGVDGCLRVCLGEEDLSS